MRKSLRYTSVWKFSHFDLIRFFEFHADADELAAQADLKKMLMKQYADLGKPK